MLSKNEKIRYWNYNFGRESVIAGFNTYFKLKLSKKNPYLLNKPLKDSNDFYTEFDMNLIFTCTKRLRKNLEISSPKINCFFNYGEFVNISKSHLKKIFRQLLMIWHDNLQEEDRQTTWCLEWQSFYSF